MFKRILVPLDGSDKSFETLEVAKEMAEKFDSEIFLLSVFKRYSFMEGSFSMIKGDTNPENLEDVLREYANSEDIVLNSESPLELPFSWPVVQEKGVWKIKFYRNQEDAN